MGMSERNKIPSVLVLGEDTRSFLSVIRSLGKSGYRVHVVCYDQASPALKSKYIHTVQYYNYQAYSQEEWLENVIALIERYKFDLVVPCDERAIYPLWSSKHKIPLNTRLAIANQEALDVLFDKWKTKKVAIECGVPVANGKVISISETSYSELQQFFGDTFVIKPLQSFEQSKLSERQKVAIVSSEVEFATYIKHTKEGKLFLIEEFFSGKGEGLSVLSIEGEVYAAYAHGRVAEPKSGGGSSYRKSIPIDAELLVATRALCARTKLTGVAMFEFRRNLNTNRWILVEVNARFWGSLPLAVYAGVDFPSIYADYLVRGVKPVHPILTYNEKAYARALIPDIYEIKRELETNRIEAGGAKALTRTSIRLLQILKAFTPSETIDSFSFNDQKPFYSEVCLLLRSLVTSLSRKSATFLSVRRFLAKHRLRNLLKTNMNRRIFFVCYGNIMRSPFAEKCMKKKLSIEPRQHLNVDSFGFHLHERRKCPEPAVQASSRLGYDLTNHRSKWLSQLDLKGSDIVIYFDDKNNIKLSSYYVTRNVFCAADFLGNHHTNLAEVADPYGESPAAIEACYSHIESAIVGLLDIYDEVLSIEA